MKRLLFILSIMWVLFPGNALAFDLVAKHLADFDHTFYIGQGSQQEITYFAKVDATTTRVSSPFHGLSNGDYIIITDSQDYTGSYAIASKTTDTFEITKVFESAESGAKWMHAYPLTSYSCESKIFSNAAGDSEIDDMDCSVDVEAGGEVSIELTDTEVDALTVNSIYYWDLILIQPDGTRDMMVSGKFFVKGRGATERTAGAGTAVGIANPALLVQIAGGRGPTGSAGSVSDTAYGVSWNGDTTTAASKNAIYDKVETLAGGHDAVTLAGTPNYLTLSTQQITMTKLDLPDDINTFTEAQLETAVSDDNPLFDGDIGTAVLAPNGDGSSLTSVDAATGDSATAFFDAGTIEHERGGLEADVSLYAGLIRITGGATSNVTNLAGLNTALGSSIADGAHTSDTNLTQEEVEDYTGALVTDGTGTHTGIAVTYQDTTGDVDMVVDHDAASNFLSAEHVDWAGAGAGTIHTDNYVENATHTGDVAGSGALTIGNDKVLETHLKAVDAAGDEECLTYEATVGDFEWQTCGGAEVNNLETVMTGALDDEVPIGGAGVAVYTALPSCSDEAETLGYNSTTNTWVCNADAGAGGGMTSWTVQADDTNTMTVSDGETVDVAGELGLKTTAATGSPEQLTIDWDYSQTLAGNPALGIDECIFSTDGTGGGIICEGTVADNFEGLVVFPFTTADRTVTFQDATHTVVGRDTTDTLTNKTIDATNTVTIEASDISDASANGQSLITAANYAAMRGLLDLEAGTDFNAYSANMDTDSTDDYTVGGTDVALADGGTGGSLVDPNADRLYAWDEAPTNGTVFLDYSAWDTNASDDALDGGAHHDGFSDFVAAEHVDWAGASAGTIHATNYVDNDTTTNETITLSGDASGSGTTAITVTVADDSHNHLITNVDSFTKAQLETQTSDVADFCEADGDVFTGVHDFGGATLEVPNSNEAGKPGTCTVGEVHMTTDGDTNGELYICPSTNTWKAVDDDGGAGSGAFSDASDPVVLNTTTKDVVIGTGAVNTSKLSIDGDADQVQLTVQANGTQTDSVIIVEDSSGTEVFALEDDGSLAIAGPFNSQVDPLVSATSVSLTDAQSGRLVIITATAQEVTLPDCDAAAVGNYYGIKERDASETISIKLTDTTNDIITFDGTALTAGHELDSPGGAGDFVWLVCEEANNWRSWGAKGTWVSGGAT